MRKKAIIFSSLFLIESFTLHAQTSTLSSGGDFKSDAGSVSYSIGQVDYNSMSNTDGSLSLGVQQTYQVKTTGLLIANIDFSLVVFPNPVTNLITLEVSKFDNQVLTYVLFDVDGKQIQTSKVIQKQTTIDMSVLPSATYLMEIYQENNKVQTFKILKVI